MNEGKVGPEVRPQETIVRVEIVQHPVFYPEEIWELNLEHVALTTEEVMEILADIPWLEGREHPASYSLSGHHGQTSWGASGSLGEYVLEVSSSALGGAGTVAVSAAIKAAFNKIRANAASETLDSLNDEAGALTIARSRISQRYGLEQDSLTLLKSQIDGPSSSYRFEFEYTDNRSFGVEIKEVGTVKTCIRMWMHSQNPVTRP